MTQIKSWTTNKVLFEYEGTIKEAVEEAVRQGISLAFADFRGADLRRADLRVANLSRANLEGANLNNANLEVADLRDADLIDADLISADLRDADLERANIRDAYLEGADLRGANLEGADLKEAYLKEADLKDANFCDADFYGAVLKFTENIPNDIMPLACPAEGSFIAWKKVDDKLVKLGIPSDAKRSSATTNKCRCSKAKVLAITNLDETKTYEKVVSNNYAPLTYKVGEMVYPDSFDEYRWNECSHGIHFFMDKEDALNW